MLTTECYLIAELGVKIRTKLSVWLVSSYLNVVKLLSVVLLVVIVPYRQHCEAKIAGSGTGKHTKLIASLTP